MSRTPLVDSTGLQKRIAQFTGGLNQYAAIGNFECILVSDLERFFEKCPVVYGYREGKQLSQVKAVDDTHTARLICVQEIKRDPFKKEYFLNTDEDALQVPNECPKRNLKITVEEIL